MAKQYKPIQIEVTTAAKLDGEFAAAGLRLEPTSNGQRGIGFAAVVDLIKFDPERFKAFCSSYLPAKTVDGHPPVASAARAKRKAMR